MINIVKRDDDKFEGHEEQEQLKKDIDTLRAQNTAQLMILRELHDRYLQKPRS